jgi:hypoxanthine phosphoribosyltransferase
MRERLPFDLDHFYVPQRYETSLEHILIPSGLIEARIHRMAEDVTQVYRREGVDEIYAVICLSGAVPFAVQLMKDRRMETTVHPLYAAIKGGYGAGTSSCDGPTVQLGDLEAIRGKHVLLMEDIVDSGQTLSAALPAIREQYAPASLRVAALLDKPAGRALGVEVPIDFCGFTIPDAFVVGCGLDYNGRFRDLPDVGVLKPEVYR